MQNMAISQTESRPRSEKNPDLEPKKQRGVRILKPRLDKPKPFGVEWRVDGKAKTEFFTTEKERDSKYEELCKKAQRGQLATVIDRNEIEEWKAFRVAIGDTDWRDVVAGWRNSLNASGAVACTLTVAEACEIYMKEQEKIHKEGGLAVDTIRHKRTKIGEMFPQAFGTNKLDAVTGEDIEDWIVEDLGFDNPDTINSYRRHIRAFFSHFSKMVRFNPADDIKIRDASVEYVNILSVKDTAKLFAYALEHNRTAIGRLALEAFMGLRFGSGQRLEKQDINFEDKGVLLPARKIKTARRFYVDGMPKNLWSWLGVTSPDCWTLSASDWMHMKSKLFTDAEVPHPHNCLRHSFATYHVAAFKNPGLTATILCHQNQQKLWGHYNGNASKSWGKKYFEITPKTALEISREEGSQHLPGLPRTSEAPGTESEPDDQTP